MGGGSLSQLVEEPGGGFEVDESAPLLEEEPMELETSIPQSEILPPSEAVSTTEVASGIDVIASATTSPAFNIPTGVGGPSLNTDSLVNKSMGRKMPAGPGGGGGRGVRTLFGFTKPFSGAMEGTMFDFKQDEDGKLVFDGDIDVSRKRYEPLFIDKGGIFPTEAPSEVIRRPHVVVEQETYYSIYLLGLSGMIQEWKLIPPHPKS